MTPPKVVIAGGSGFLGLSLAAHLTSRGYQVTILSRTPPKGTNFFAHAPWDGRTLGNWATTLESATALVNLAGRSVDCVKTPDNCDQILRSRVESTLVLGQALRTLTTPPPVWVQMSTAHIYGDPPSARCDEDSTFGYGLAPTVGIAWEKALETALAHSPTTRRVILRTSFVLGRNGPAGAGALSKLVPLTKCLLGGTVGSGSQGISWIHEDDMNALFEHAITSPTCSGPIIATAPNPIPQREFAAELRRALGIPIGLPAPAFAVKIAAPLLLNTDPDLALYGRYITSKRLRESNFPFKYPTIREALSNLFSKP
jgi:uncharacterized protein (TIGR01777 family)